MGPSDDNRNRNRNKCYHIPLEDLKQGCHVYKAGTSTVIHFENKYNSTYKAT